MIKSMSEKFSGQIENLNHNITTINRTLTSKIDWSSTDQKANHVRIYTFIFWEYL